MEYVVDSYFVKPDTPVWIECDTICYRSKNLFNQANYRIRQHWFSNHKYLSYNNIQKQLQSEKVNCYTALPAKVAQQVLRSLDSCWQAYFAALKSFSQNPTKFAGKPNPPNYKDVNGRNSTTFNIQAISKRQLNETKLKLSGLSFLVDLRLVEEIDSDGVCTYRTRPNLRDVTIIPRNDGYEIVVKYLKEKEQPKICGSYSAGIDIGLNNLATIITNNKYAESFIINGKPLKALNAYYNKRTAEIQSKIATQKSKKEQRRLKQERKKLARKRHFRIKHYLHEASSIVVTQLVSLGVQTLVIGKNTGWKQEINIGSRNNQNFVYVPHAKFISMLQYKWARIGGEVILQEESYTSKCSMLDLEEVRKHEVYAGKRVKRGLFVSGTGKELNADINGAGNILRKGIGNAFSDWSEAELIKGFCSYPRRVTPPRQKHRK